MGLENPHVAVNGGMISVLPKDGVKKNTPKKSCAAIRKKSVKKGTFGFLRQFCRFQQHFLFIQGQCKQEESKYLFKLSIFRLPLIHPAIIPYR